MEPHGGGQQVTKNLFMSDYEAGDRECDGAIVHRS